MMRLPEEYCENMRQLPEEYRENMRQLLGEEYAAYEASFGQQPCAALRINTSKISLERWEELCPFPVESVPWCEKGFYFEPSAAQASKHPYYFAGLYYIQEPSAMIPASILPVKPGDRVLDLCAAPGGKATELAAKLNGTGLLVANDISVSRAMALAKNLQMAGAVNAVVTAEKPENLASRLPNFFDSILIDAPCSGEGMFRREPRMIKDWIERGPQYYAAVQRDILREAYRMLRPGGYLVYSTCTFSTMEDEEMMHWFLEQYPDMRLCPVERRAGFAPGRTDSVGDGTSCLPLEHCVRIFPHKARGEGHFAALLQKQGEAERENKEARGTSNRGKRSSEGLEKAQEWVERFSLPEGCFQKKKEHVILVPKQWSDPAGIRVIQSGVIVGVQKRRFEPSPQLALVAAKRQRIPYLPLAGQDIRAVKYLKGETIEADGLCLEAELKACDGMVLVCVDGFALGWAKYSGNGMLKNKYYAGWRLQ